MHRITYSKSVCGKKTCEDSLKKSSEKSWLILDSSNLIQLFPMTLYSVLVEMKVVSNDVMNNFELHNQLSRIHSFLSKSLRSWQNSAILHKESFLVNFRGSLRENGASSGVGHDIQSCCK